MGSIKDILSKKLPTGRKFQAKVGTGNFKDSLRAATRTGMFENLANNQDVLNTIAEKYQQKIRRGEFTASMAEDAFRQAKKADKTFTKDDEGDLKKILEYLSKGDTSKTPETAKSSKANKRADRVRKTKDKLKPSPRKERPSRKRFDFSKKRDSAEKSESRFIIPDNPLSRQPRNTNINVNPEGSGGGMFTGSGQAKSSGSFRKPIFPK